MDLFSLSRYASLPNLCDIVTEHLSHSVDSYFLRVLVLSMVGVLVERYLVCSPGIVPE